MSDGWIIKHCSPTLAGIKTGSIFVCPCPNAGEVRQSIRGWNRLLGRKGLRVLPLRLRNGRALVYVYRPTKLRQDLQQDAACVLLQKRGYDMKTPDRCIIHLIKRLEERDEFPHEIGLFLGYPPEDVRGFIDNRARNFKCVGCWKVYGDADAAQKVFAKYKKCTDVYCARYAQGESIERLTVAG